MLVLLNLSKFMYNLILLLYLIKSKYRLLSLVLTEGLYDVAKLMIEKGAEINVSDWVSYQSMLCSLHRLIIFVYNDNFCQKKLLILWILIKINAILK